MAAAPSTAAARQRLQASASICPAPVTSDEVREFSDHGWYFVADRQALADATALGLHGVGRVLRDQWNGENGLRICDGGLLIVACDGVRQDRVVAELHQQGVAYVRRFRWSHWVYEGRCPPHIDPFEIADALASRSWVRHAQPIVLEPMTSGHGTGPLPAEPAFPKTVPPQTPKDAWHIKAIGCRDAWRTSTGRGQTVAILDGWFDPRHEALRSGIRADSATAHVNECGTTEWVERVVPPFVGGADVHHGTLVAGLISARPPGGAPPLGVAPDARLWLHAHAGTRAPGAWLFAQMIARAAGNHPMLRADVLVCSIALSGGPLDVVLHEALDFARDCGRGGLGMPIFWSAKASGRIASDPIAAHSSSIMVAKSDNTEDCFNKAFDADRLDFVAPGVDVWSTTTEWAGRYDARSGNSFATPCAAAVAALMTAANPHLPADVVRQILHESCVKIGPAASYDRCGRNLSCGSGRVDAAAAVNLARGECR